MRSSACFNKGGEELGVFLHFVGQRFRVPLDAEDKAIPLHFDGLHNPVRRKGGGVEVISQSFHGLMMETVDHYLCFPDDIMKSGARIQVHLVDERIHAKYFRYRVGDKGAFESRLEVLMQRSPCADVQQLHPSADSQHGDMGLVQNAAEQVEFVAISLLVDCSVPDAHVFSVVPRSDIHSSAENDP